MTCGVRTYAPDHPTCRTCPIQEECAPQEEKKPSKYRNEKVEVDGEKFDSKREYARFQQLKLLERAGKISGLKRQVVFELAPALVINGKKKRALRYYADFLYLEQPGNQLVVEDSKGVRTKEFIIKQHLMKWLHNIDVQEL
jgi:adenine-specific DNA glycosylase